MLGRRLAIAATASGAAFSLAVSVSGPASASTVLYQNSRANVKIAGGEVTALNNCLADALDGVIQTQTAACDQVASTGNAVTLDDVSVWVTSATQPPVMLYRGTKVKVSVSGKVVSAINACIAYARDGHIDPVLTETPTAETWATTACHQVPSAGNVISLADVSVQVDQL
jgi:hypothetical protein